MCIHVRRPVPRGELEEPPRDLKDVKFVLEDNGVAIITLERCVVLSLSLGPR